MTKPWFSPVILAWMVLAGPVFGHARLLSTSPADGARLELAPRSLTLKFNEDARLATLTLTVAGKEVALSVDRSAPAASTLTVALPALAAGTYRVRWSALSSADGHVTKGIIEFTVVNAAAAHDGMAPPAASTNPPAGPR